MLATTTDQEQAYNLLPPDPEAWVRALNLQMTINGVDAPSQARSTVVNPGTTLEVTDYPEADMTHLDSAVAAAIAAFPAWAARPWDERRAAMMHFADLVEKAHQDLTVILACESGRPLRWAHIEITATVRYIRIIAALELPPRNVSIPGVRAVLRRKAMGVVGGIAPWNAPVVLGAAKIANALMAGDTMILRPSPFTPLTALYLGMIGREAFPPGVFNVITGDASVGGAMTAHPGIAKISFTGSTETGKKIAMAAAPTLKKLTLELGGNDPAIVLPDADINALTQTVYGIALQNCGHFCAAVKRLYVHEDVYDEVCESIAARCHAAVLGTSFDPAVTMGPLQNKQQFDRVWDLFDDAVSHGGRVIVGGDRINRPGLFIPPTLVDGIDGDVRLVKEEQFGPVLPIIRFKDVDRALEMANDTNYGLGGSIWTKDIERGVALADRLEAGTGWVNQHGAFTAALPMAFAKESGLGIDFAEYGLAEHARPMLVNLRL